MDFKVGLVPSEFSLESILKNTFQLSSKVMDKFTLPRLPVLRSYLIARNRPMKIVGLYIVIGMLI